MPLQHLNLDRNAKNFNGDEKLKSETVCAGTLALANCPTLSSLSLSQCNLKSDDIKELAKSPSIQVLNVGYNPEIIRDTTCFDQLAKSSVTNLDLSRVSINTEICEKLAASPSLKRLNLYGCIINDAGARALAKSSSITHLEVERCKLTKVAASAFSANNTLLILNLNQNDVGDEGAIALATHPTLHTLCLQLNNIQERGIRALAENKKLISLDLRNNLQKNPNVFVVFLSNRNLEDLQIHLMSDPRDPAHEVKLDLLAKIDERIQENINLKTQPLKKPSPSSFFSALPQDLNSMIADYLSPPGPRKSK